MVRQLIEKAKNILTPWPRPTKPGAGVIGCILVGLGLGLTSYATHADVTIASWLKQMVPGADGLGWHAMTQFGNGAVLLVLAVIVAALVARRDLQRARVWAWLGPLSLLAGAAAQLFLKIPFGRPRPKLYPLYDMQWFEFAGSLRGFPSGHTLTAFFAVGLLWQFYPRLRWLMLGMAVLVGLSRVMVGAHWPGDVIAGAFVGAACGWWSVRWLNPAEKNRPKETEQ